MLPGAATKPRGANRYEFYGLTYTFHPHVIGRGQRMLALEAFIERLASEGVRFVTMETAVASYRDRHPKGVSLRG